MPMLASMSASPAKIPSRIIEKRRAATEFAMISFIVCAPKTTCWLLIRSLARRKDSKTGAEFCERASTPIPEADCAMALSGSCMNGV